MPEPRVTVAIPVGPEPHHREWLAEAVESVKGQTVPTGVILIDDMADLVVYAHAFNLHRVEMRWRVGVATAFNYGVACAPTDLVFMLGSDDWLEPECIEECLRVYDARPAEKRDLGYYYVGVRYTDERDDQMLPCNAAMVTKALWRATGGFPPETGVGAPDAALISMLMTHPDVADIIPVEGKRPLYNHRIHPGQDTAGRAPYQPAIHNVRDVLTREWKPPRWGRYA